jgi:hypothetical protein
MTVERIIRIVAGALVVVGTALGHGGSPAYVSRAFLAIPAFVGLNLFQSGFTRFCPLEILLRRAGVPGAASTSSGRGRDDRSA